MWHFVCVCVFKNVQSFLPPKHFLQDVFSILQTLCMSGYRFILQLIKLICSRCCSRCFSIILGGFWLFSVIRYTAKQLCTVSDNQSKQQNKMLSFINMKYTYRYDVRTTLFTTMMTKEQTP